MPWKTSSGLLDDYDYVIERAIFTTSADYVDEAGNQPLLLILEGTATDSEGDVHEEHQERYSVGKDWTSTDGGKTCVSDKGAKFINKNSLYGRFLTHAQKTVEGTIDSKGNDLLERRSSLPGTEASVWVGLSFHMTEEAIEFGKKGNIKPTARCMPVAFLGEVESNGKAPASKPAARTQGAGATKAQEAIARAKAAAAKASTPEETDSTRAKLADFAKESPSWESFIEKAYELDEVQKDDTLQGEVGDDSESGFYATHH